MDYHNLRFLISGLLILTPFLYYLLIIYHIEKYKGITDLKMSEWIKERYGWRHLLLLFVIAITYAFLSYVSKYF